MCGINGLIYKAPDMKGAAVINTMNDCIVHRGPDDDGLYNYQDSVYFGMRRLAIIDLETGKQPIANEDGSMVIVLNGEIYNYRELRDSLIAKGVRFKTHSDTEVVLRLYEMYGVEMMNMLNGMFAFSIHDHAKGIVFIARDRFGEKPLYYTADKNRFVWASELKSIVKEYPDLKEIDESVLRMYLALTYIPAPHTIYKNIVKLKPASYIIVDTSDLSYSLASYWDVAPDPARFNSNYKLAKAELKQLVFDSVEKRMVADVPVGVFLSGGVDSTIVASIMASISSKKIKTFTVGYKDKRYDESQRANQIARHIGSEHYVYQLDYSEILDDLDKIILNYDEPYADSSCLPTYFISKKTSEQVKVALTGDGGDEMFGGYNKYLLQTYGRLYQKLMPSYFSKQIPGLLQKIAGARTDSKSKVTKAIKMFESLKADAVGNHLNIIQLGFRGESLDQLMSSTGKNVNEMLRNLFVIPGQINTGLKKARYIDKEISLEGDLLVKVDRASMLTSLECRAPFLDQSIIDFSFNIPDNFLIKGNNKKRILKDTFEYLLPQGFFNAPKSGFEIPVGSWMRKELFEEVHTTLSQDNLDKHGYFNYAYVKNLLNEHDLGHIDHSFKLWTLFCFQKWYNNQ